MPRRGWILFWFVSTQISHLRRWDTEDTGAGGQQKQFRKIEWQQKPKTI
jgi:hypothetical protein